MLAHTDAGTVGQDDLLLLADAQTSGGLLVVEELPGASVIGSWSGAARQRVHHPQPGIRASAAPVLRRCARRMNAFVGLCTG